MVGIAERLCSEPLPGVRRGERRSVPAPGMTGKSEHRPPGASKRARSSVLLARLSRRIAAAVRERWAKAWVPRPGET